MKKKLTFLSMAILVIAVFSLSGCKKDKKSEEGSDYSGIKTDNWRSKIGDSVSVEGYYDETSGLGKLYNKPEFRDRDANTPEANYIYIAKPDAVTHVPDYSHLIGRRVKITGVLQAEGREPSLLGSSKLLGDVSLAKVKVARVQFIDSVSYFRIPIKVNFCEQYPGICQILIDPFPTKVAFLYSGGINAGNAHQRYYNDIKALYWILRNKFGYSDKNIVVCYKNGQHDYIASDTFHIDYDASKAGFDAAINDLNNRMGARTQFFCFINNHGGGFSTSENVNYGGTAAAAGKEPASDSKNMDEHIYYYGESSDISDNLLADKINSLTFGKGIFLLKPCFSGGLVWDIRGANRVILSSGTEFQVTYPTPDGNYGELTYNFMTAITGKKPDGGTVTGVDLNGDGKISMYEAYIYIKNNERRSEQPQYNDDGTGSVTTSPSSAGFGAGVFL